MVIETSEHVHAPEFPSGLTWINSAPLSLSGLRGKVILVDIWDYTCINCIRTLPYLNEWHARYAADGLTVIGVHTPEFGFARDPADVEAAVRRFDIRYPVVLDNDYRIWSSYANQFWPRKYLIDSRGYIVYDHAGEGGYRETELVIQKYLGTLNPSLSFPEPYAAPGARESGGICYPVTPELYCGYERGRLANPEGYRPGTSVLYHDRNEYIDGYLYANGLWLSRPESLSHARRDEKGEDYIGLTYHALSVNAVLRPGKGGASYRVEVRQDDASLDSRDAGEDLRIDNDGRSWLEIDEARMYRIVRNREFGSHVLRLYSGSESFEIYSFTFGSCANTGRDANR